MMYRAFSALAVAGLISRDGIDAFGAEQLAASPQGAAPERHHSSKDSGGMARSPRHMERRRHGSEDLSTASSTASIPKQSPFITGTPQLAEAAS